MLDSLNLIKRNTFFLAIVAALLAAIASWQSPGLESEKDNKVKIISPASTPIIQ